MIYRILSDIIIGFHFLWILFIVFGIIFVLRKSRIAWIHLGGILFSLLINSLEWYCPLTYLEYYLESLGQPDLNYSGAFIARYLEHIVYPQFSERIIRTGEILFVLIYLLIYLVVGTKIWLNMKKTDKPENTDNMSI